MSRMRRILAAAALLAGLGTAASADDWRYYRYFNDPYTYNNLYGVRYLVPPTISTTYVDDDDGYRYFTPTTSRRIVTRRYFTDSNSYYNTSIPNRVHVHHDWDDDDDDD